VRRVTFYPIFIAACVLLVTPTGAGAHGDPLDSHGCHKNRGAGGYHCHKGPFAGRTFMSKEEMLKALAQRKGGTRRP
jgi:hypothetical protein